MCLELVLHTLSQQAVFLTLSSSGDKNLICATLPCTTLFIWCATIYYGHIKRVGPCFQTVMYLGANWPPENKTLTQKV